MTTHQHSDLIDFLGGTNAVAELFGIKPPSVTEWRERGIPRGRLLELAPLVERRRGSPWTRKTLFPDDWHVIWPELSRKASRTTARLRA